MSSGVPHDFTLNAATPGTSPECRLVRRLGWCVFFAFAPVLGGCAMSFPMASLLPGDDVTAFELAHPVRPPSRRRGAPPRKGGAGHRARSAGRWRDGEVGQRQVPATWARSTAMEKAFSRDGKICRGFIGELKTGRLDPKAAWHRLRRISRRVEGDREQASQVLSRSFARQRRPATDQRPRMPFPNCLKRSL